MEEKRNNLASYRYLILHKSSVFKSFYFTGNSTMESSAGYALNFFEKVIEGSKFTKFYPGMDYATLEPPTTADITFVFNNVTKLLTGRSDYTIINCTKDDFQEDGPVMTIHKATVYIDAPM